jgi:hypothetical protein
MRMLIAEAVRLIFCSIDIVLFVGLGLLVLNSFFEKLDDIGISNKDKL